MFKKNENVNGLSFSMVYTSNGLPITTGTVSAKLIQDGGSSVNLIAAPEHRDTGTWTANISAEEMNYDIVSVSFIHDNAVPVTYTIKTTEKLVSELNDFSYTTDIVNANVYSINSNTDSAILLQQYIPRLDDNISSRSDFDPATDTVQKANIYAINSNTESAVLLQSYIPRLDINVSDSSTSGTINANIVSVQGVTVTSANDFKADVSGLSTFDPTTDTVQKANLYSINSNTDAAVQLQQFVPRIDTNISSVGTSGLVNANVYSINGNTQAAVLLQSYIPRLDENVSAGSFSGTVDANVVSVQGIAVSSIDDFKADVSGLSTFDPTLDIVQKANVYSINSNTESAVQLAEKISRLDTTISSRSIAGDEMNLVDAPNATAITAIQNGLSTFDAGSDTVDADIVSIQTVAVSSIDDFKADVSGLSTFDASTDTVNANMIAIYGNSAAASELSANVHYIDTNISTVSATVNSTAVAEAIFNTEIDGTVQFDQAVQRILAMVVNAQIISGTDPITLIGRNSANTANVVIQSHPVASPTGRSVTF